MKKRIIYGLALAGIAGVIFLSGCSKIEPQSEGVPIRISAGLSMYTRATDTSFEQGDALGLYLVKWTSGTPGILQGTGNYGDNLPFSLTSSGWQTNVTAQYPQDGEKLDFYAYYPYVSSSALDGEGYRVHRVAADQRQESAYKGSDLLMASASGVSAGRSAVHLQFSHMLSKMEIEMKAGEGLTLEELTEATIAIKGVKTSGKVHLSSKAYQTDETKEDVIAHGTFSLASEGEKVSGVSAIVYPQEIATGTGLIEIGLGGEKYLFTTTKPITLRSGYKSVFTITMSRNGLSVETGVTDWTEGEGDEGEAQWEVVIPDEVFRSYIVELLKAEGIKSPEWDGGAIHRQDVEKITRIDIPAPGSTEPKIKTLAGIEYFTALEYLSFRMQEVSAIDVSKNTALKYLDCSYNQLTTLDVSRNTALEYLECYKNLLTSLDVSQNTVLDTLGCSNNQLSALDVSRNTTLNILFCCYNQLTALDVSQNMELMHLNCYNNQLTSLDVSENRKLEYLYCNDNQLTTLDVSQNTVLRFLNCYNNQLTSLKINGCTSLKLLFCYNNLLSSLVASGCTALTMLECWNNQLTSLDVSQNTALMHLQCYDNQLTSLDISKNTALKSFRCYNNPGDGAVFPVTAWFGNDAIPSDFTSGSWTYGGNTISIDYRSVE